MCKLSRDEAVHVRAAPVIVDEKVVAGGQRRDALVQPLLEQFRVRFPGRVPHDSLHDRQQVLRAVMNLAHQEIPLFRGPLELADIAIEHNHAIDGAVLAPHRQEDRVK